MAEGEADTLRWTPFAVYKGAIPLPTPFRMTPADDLANCRNQVLGWSIGIYIRKFYFLCIPYPQPVLQTFWHRRLDRKQVQPDLPLKVLRIVEYLIDNFVKHMTA